MISQNRHKLLIGTLLVLAYSTAGAQEIELSSWTLHDPNHESQLAASVIEKANDWLTRDDPYAPTARLDDTLKIAVIIEHDMRNGIPHTRLARLTMGSVVIDSGFSQFLDSGEIASLIRRNYFWRDEHIESLTGSPQIDEEEEDWRSEYALETAFAIDEVARGRFAIDESRYRLGRELHLWGGIGFEELALPDFSYGKLRLGVRYQRVKIWGEAPLEIGDQENPVLARGLDGAFGFGMSVDHRYFGGAISWSDPGDRVPPDTPVIPPTRLTYALGRTAMVHGTIPIGAVPSIGGFLRGKIGAGYIQTIITSPYAGQSEQDNGEEVERVGVLARLEYSNRTGTLGREVAIEVFGKSLLASYREEFTPLLGVRVVVAKHGLLGELDPWLPSYSVSISPTLTFR